MEWEAWYPFECFSGFWSYLTKLNILIVPEVIEECSNDNFDRWFKLLGDTQRFEPTTESLRLAAKLEDKFPGCKPRGAQNLADLQVAAAAKLNGGTILTEETSKPDEEGNVEFPKMHIDQRGASYRYNVDDNTWVEKNTNSLIWDLITSHDGQMEVGGKQFDVWSTEEVPAGEGKYCAGTDPLALDIEQDIQLKGWECSSGNALLEPVELTLEQCRGEDTAPPSIEGCQVAMPGARTSLETITASFEDKVLHCVAVEKRGVPIAECDPRYAIVHKRVNADLLDVDNSYFVEGSFEKSDAALPGKTNTMEVVRNHGGMDGVCADGSGDDGNFSISLFTRDGTSVPHANSCHISDLFRLLYLSGMRHSTRPTVGCAA